MKAGDKVTWRTVNGHASGVLVREVVEGSKVWAVKMEDGNHLPVHENSMIPDTNEDYNNIRRK